MAQRWPNLTKEVVRPCILRYIKSELQPSCEPVSVLYAPLAFRDRIRSGEAGHGLVNGWFQRLREKVDMLCRCAEAIEQRITNATALRDTAGNHKLKHEKESTCRQIWMIFPSFEYSDFFPRCVSFHKTHSWSSR